MMWEMEFDDNKVVGINRGYLCTQRKKREERGKKITLLRIQKRKDVENKTNNKKHTERKRKGRCDNTEKR